MRKLIVKEINWLTQNLHIVSIKAKIEPKTPNLILSTLKSNSDKQKDLARVLFQFDFSYLGYFHRWCRGVIFELSFQMALWVKVEYHEMS